MKKLILALVLMCPVIAHSLELKMGLMAVDAPLYEGVYSGPNAPVSPPIDDTGLVGRIELGHEFEMSSNLGINVFIMHMSLFNERDPHYGINGIGTELVLILD